MFVPARGEPTPTVGEIIDYILAPLYLRVLFGIPRRKTHAATLAERLLRLADWPPPGLINSPLFGN